MAPSRRCRRQIICKQHTPCQGVRRTLAHVLTAARECGEKECACGAGSWAEGTRTKDVGLIWSDLVWSDLVWSGSDL